jgi:hypothetical protein
MTLGEWTAEVCGALRQDGFIVDVYWSFPLVREPLTLAQRFKLLEVKLPLATDRRIYAEGMLFVPAGSPLP